MPRAAHGYLAAAGALGLVLAAAFAFPAAAGGPADSDAAVRKAVGFLAAEVPRWSRENRCYSCHNNGDAARALYDARRRALAFAPEALADTTRWLARPEAWDANGGEGPFSDKRLARVQFAAALASAVASGDLTDRAPLDRAARKLAGDQSADGSWTMEGGDAAIGSPSAYGRPLATLVARDTLRAADPDRFRGAIDRADRWLYARPVATMLDASVTLLATSGRREPGASALRLRALDRLRAGQSPDGGWGPYAEAPPEPFDTALALLALARLDPSPETRVMIRRGRDFLTSSQRSDGSWTETTRPAGGESYAQRLSTAGWAALALLATDGH